jgi:basic amino acid/polyamine antiporter, APA family
VNLRGIQGGKVIQNVFTIAKTTALIGLIVVAIMLGRSQSTVAANLSSFWDALRTSADGARTPLVGMGLLAAIGAAMVGSLFSSDAWNNITFTAAEVVKPQRTIPLSLFLGTVIVTFVYILANVAYLLVLPVFGNPSAAGVLERGIQFATNDRVGTAAATVIFGDAGALVMAILIMVSTFGCNNGLILAGARVYYAMAKDGLFFAAAGRLNPSGVPAGALLTQAVWASALCLSGTYGDLLDYVIFAVLVFYILTVVGVFILRRKRPEAERPYRAIGYPVLPGLYVILATAIAVDLLILKPSYTWPGLGLVVLGIPVYFLWARHKPVPTAGN